MLKTFNRGTLLVVLLAALPAWAQTGFNPEFLGNGAPGPYGGLCAKYFTSYFYQNSPKAHDIETALEPQLFTKGFTGEAKKDQLLFLLHLPVGYRREGPLSGGGVGSARVNVHHFWHLMEREQSDVWFDNGVSIGFPTATQNDGIRIGGNSFSLGYYQETFVRWGSWRASMVPASLSWGFQDYRTEETGGLSLSLMNGAIGRQWGSRTRVGLNGGVLLGHLLGSRDAVGGSLPRSVRFYLGPAASVSLKKNLSLQIGTAIDLVTRETDRGQGIFLALWHHFFTF